MNSTPIDKNKRETIIRILLLYIKKFGKRCASDSLKVSAHINNQIDILIECRQSINFLMRDYCIPSQILRSETELLTDDLFVRKVIEVISNDIEEYYQTLIRLKDYEMFVIVDSMRYSIYQRNIQCDIKARL